LNNHTLALFHSTWPAESPSRPRYTHPLALYRYAVWYKANPRSANYMRALLRRYFADAEWLEVDSHRDWIERVRRAETIVLLYPDSIGLGFGSIERAIMKNKNRASRMHVINGRCRVFEFDRTTRGRLRLRRFLEWTMLPELLFLPAFVVATPLLWITDAIRGRR
jgi:hypothetical protein